MARRLIRTIYGADFFQLSLNSSSCTKEYRLCACVLRVEGRAKAAQLHTLARQGPQPFSQALSRAHVLEVSQTSSRTKLTSFTTFPLRHTHHHLYCHTHSHLHQTDNSWGHRHHCLQQQQCRPYAKKAKKSAAQKLSEEDQDIINLERVESSMEAAISGLKYEYTNSIITRITPASLDKVSVEVDGEWYQLKQVAQIGMPSPQTIVINMASHPQATESVVAALRDAELNLNPIAKKNVIKVPLPKMTKELRESLVKVAKAAAEKCKIGVRKSRQKAMSNLKKKNDVSKDSVRRLEKHIQELTDKHTGRIEELFKAKSAELLKGS